MNGSAVARETDLEETETMKKLTESFSYLEQVMQTFNIFQIFTHSEKVNQLHYEI